MLLNDIMITQTSYNLKTFVQRRLQPMHSYMLQSLDSLTLGLNLDHGLQLQKQSPLS